MHLQFKPKLILPSDLHSAPVTVHKLTLAMAVHLWHWLKFSQKSKALLVFITLYSVVSRGSFSFSATIQPNSDYSNQNVGDIKKLFSKHFSVYKNTLLWMAQRWQSEDRKEDGEVLTIWHNCYTKRSWPVFQICFLSTHTEKLLDEEMQENMSNDPVNSLVDKQPLQLPKAWAPYWAKQMEAETGCQIKMQEWGSVKDNRMKRQTQHGRSRRGPVRTDQREWQGRTRQGQNEESVGGQENPGAYSRGKENMKMPMELAILNGTYQNQDTNRSSVPQWPPQGRFSLLRTPRDQAGSPIRNSIRPIQRAALLLNDGSINTTPKNHPATNVSAWVPHHTVGL